MPKPDGLAVGRVVHYAPTGNEAAGGGLLKGPIGGRISRIDDGIGGERQTLHLDVVSGHHGVFIFPVVVISAPFDPSGAPGTWRYPPRA